MRNSFVLFQSYKEYFEDLSGDEAKELLLAIFEYENTRVKPTNLSTKVGCYFLVIKQQLDKNYDEYLKIVEKNRENGGKRWNKKMPNNAKNASGINGMPKMHDNDNEYVNDVVNDDEYVNDNDKNNRKENKKKSAKGTMSAKFQKPLKQELKDFALQNQLSVDILDDFYDYYESNGWRVGRGGLPMKDWKATYRRWSRNQYGKPKNKSSGNPFKEKLRELEAEEQIVDVGEE